MGARRADRPTLDRSEAATQEGQDRWIRGMGRGELPVHDAHGPTLYAVRPRPGQLAEIGQPVRNRLRSPVDDGAASVLCADTSAVADTKIGRASCREGVED